MIWTKDDIITSDKYLVSFPKYYYKMDVIMYNKPIIWRNKIHNPPSHHEKIIISGHSDFPVTDQVVRRYPLAKWFGINKQSSLCHGLPLGITNNTNESSLHSIYGDIDSMLDTVAKPRTIHNLVYMNFSVGTYPHERQMVWNMFKEKKWVTCEEPTNSLEGRKHFLSQIRNHHFVLCPRGNGIDTHRLWETLYMGSIPIVLQNIAHSGWTDLPILFVNSWDEVTEELLIKELNRIQTTTWNYNKLNINYWIKYIHNESRYDFNSH